MSLIESKASLTQPHSDFDVKIVRVPGEEKYVWLTTGDKSQLLFSTDALTWRPDPEGVFSLIEAYIAIMEKRKVRRKRAP